MPITLVHYPYSQREVKDSQGRLHSYERPAFWADSNYFMWYEHGAIHCSTGPAIVKVDKVYWYFKGHHMSHKKWKRIINMTQPQLAQWLLEEL